MQPVLQRSSEYQFIAFGLTIPGFKLTICHIPIEYAYLYHRYEEQKGISYCMWRPNSNKIKWNYLVYWKKNIACLFGFGLPLQTLVAIQSVLSCSVNVQSFIYKFDMYLFTYTGVKHDFNTIWCSCTTTGATSWAGVSSPSEAPKFTSVI